MLQGTVSFVAMIRGGLQFDRFEYDPKTPGVAKMELEAPDGELIRTTVHLSAVPTEDAGRALASEVNAKALHRIAFTRGLWIENARVTGDVFAPVNTPSGTGYIKIIESNISLGGRSGASRASPQNT